VRVRSGRGPGATGLRRRGELAKEVSSAAVPGRAAPTLADPAPSRGVIVGGGELTNGVRMPVAFLPRPGPPAAPPRRARPGRRPTARAWSWRRRLPAVAAVAAAAGLLLLVGLAGPAVAQTPDPTLGQVIERLRNVLVGLLIALATLLLTVGGLRYLLAGGDPGQVEKAKVTLRSAAIGYGLAALAPALVRLLRFVVGT
jgi:Type IV secretion system pilin